MTNTQAKHYPRVKKPLLLSGCYMTALLLMIAGVLLTSTIGAVPITLSEIPTLIFSTELSEQQTLLRTILIDIRLPRIIVAITVGAGLAITGCAMQALCRNPLAEPGLLGVSSSAALGAVLALVLGNTSPYAVSSSAFISALIATWLVWQLGQRFSHLAGLLLTGIAINAIATSLTGLLMTFASDTSLRSFTFWSMGGLTDASWQIISWLTPTVVLLSLWISYDWRALNALLLGEREAGHLGFPLPALKRRIIFLTACLVGVTVAACGTIGFVGLVIPHVVRLIVGANHRTLLPLSALVGSTGLLLADWLARITISPAELPVGIVTSIVGGPFFLFLLFSQRKNL